MQALPQWSADASERLELLVALLTEENTHQNLVSKASLEHVWQRHLADSAQLLSHVSRETIGSWIDLGSGAGFPGLVIACLEPSRPITLIESRRGRIEWLERVRTKLDLQNVTVCGKRLEQVETHSVSVISARAFAPLGLLLDLSARFSTAETLWLLPKGRSAQQELDQLKGWKHLFHVKQSLTDAEAGIIVGTLRGRKEK